MAVSPEKIKDLLTQQFLNADIELTDYAGDQDHYELKIISTQFQGLSQVKRHQLVYKCLGSIVGNSLHAISIKTLTPQEIQ